MAARPSPRSSSASSQDSWPAHLPGYAETQAVAALIGAACVSVLRLPLASVMIATLLSAKAGLAVAPLIVVAVAVAYLTSEALTAFVDARIGAAPSHEQTAHR